MKGKLINKDQKWIVQYEEVDNTSFGIAAATGGAIIPSVKELPLHPDNLEQERYFIINENVKFEIVEETLSNLDGDMRKNYKFAKLIQSEEDYFKLITKGCGFSTTAECRKAINELENEENPNKAWDNTAKAMGGIPEETNLESLHYEFLLNLIDEFLEDNHPIKHSNSYKYFKNERINNL